MPATRKSLVRELNDAQVLAAVRASGTMSRAEIARHLGLSGATVTGITSRILEAGLLMEAHVGESVGGRPPKMLAINPHGARVVGAVIEETEIYAVTLDFVGSVLDTETKEWDGSSPADAERVLISLVDRLEHRGGRPFSGLGVTLSGVIDDRTGTILHSGLLGWDEVPLGTSLAERLGVRVQLEGRPGALAAATKFSSAGHEVRNAIFVTTGHSLGVSVVVGGGIWNEVRSPVGGLAHTKVMLSHSSEAALCHCGARGCLETVASEWALQEFVRRLGYGSLDEATAQVEADSRIAAKFESAGRYLGQMVGNLATVAAPDCVFLGGETVRLGPAFLDPLRQELAASSTFGCDWTLSVCDTNEQTWASGAGLQVLDTIVKTGAL